MLKPARMFARLITGIAASKPTPSDETFTPIPIFPADSNADGFPAGGVCECCVGVREMSAASTLVVGRSEVAFGVEFPSSAPAGMAIAKEPSISTPAHTAKLTHEIPLN